MSEFTKVCSLEDLVPGAGVAALVEGEQVALFYVADEVYAVGNFDPIGKAYVMSRGMTGDLNGQIMVASPLQKNHYNLQTGESMDKEGVSLPVYEVIVENDTVYVKV